MGNEHALNKHLEKQQQREKFLNMFIDEIDDDLVEMQKMKKQLRNKANDYYGYDFSNELNEFVSDLI